jgi:hypothetical protein
MLYKMSQEAKKRDPTIYRRIEWKSKLKRLYGISVEDYYLMLSAQNGGCAICGSLVPHSRKYTETQEVMFSIDHSHQTGKVRGLLCTKCNRALGLIGDNPQIAMKMASYLIEGEYLGKHSSNVRQL